MFPGFLKLIEITWAKTKGQLPDLIAVTILISASAELSAVPYVGLALSFAAVLFYSSILILLARRNTISSAAAQVIQKFPSILLINGLVWLMSSGAFALFVVPGVILTLFFQFATPIFLDENSKGLRALFRSYQLVRPQAWTVFDRWQSLLFYEGLLFVGLGFVYRFLNHEFVAALIAICSAVAITFNVFYLVTLYQIVKDIKTPETIPLYKKLLIIVGYFGLITVVALWLVSHLIKR